MNVIALSCAKTLVQWKCEYERRLMFTTTASHSTSQQQPSLAVTPNDRVRPLFSRHRRFFPQIAPQREDPTPESDHVQDRSTCPWVLVQDYNFTRIPRIMQRAVCSHNNGDNSCDASFLDVDRSHPYVRHVLDMMNVETECALVYSKMLVIVECCEQGNYVRKQEMIDWPVACTCARKRIVTVTPASRD